MRALADMIQSETGGDLFSIQTSVVCPSPIILFHNSPKSEKERLAFVRYFFIKR